MLFAARRELLGSKGERLVDQASTDELDETLLLQMEKEQRIVVQNLRCKKREADARQHD